MHGRFCNPTIIANKGVLCRGKIIPKNIEGRLLLIVERSKNSSTTYTVYIYRVRA